MPRAAALGIVAITALAALAVRALGFESVFVGDEEVALWLGDAPYHARLAEYAHANFPSFLAFDPYLNYPRGAPVPWPPLYDWLVALVAKLSGARVEVVLAWAPALLGALTTLPVYAAAQRLGGPGTGLLAAGIYALLGVAVGSSTIGNADHPAAVGLCGAVLMALTLVALDGERRGRALAGLCLGLALARGAMLVTWSGSLLYLAITSAALMLGAILERRRDLLALEAVSSALAALAVAPVVAIFTRQGAAPISTIGLSWLQIAALGAAAWVAGALWLAEGWRPSRSLAVRATRLLGVCATILLALLAVPGLRDALAPALLFVGGGSGFRVTEQTPLFGLARLGSSPLVYFGFFAYLVPLAPLAGIAAAGEPGRRLPGFGLVTWTLALGLLTVQQFRFGNDFAAAAAVSFAIGIWLLLAALGPRLGLASARRRGVAAALLAGVALLPCLLAFHGPRLAASWAALNAPAGQDRALAGPAGSLARFNRQVRELTPPTRSYLADEGKPEYGVLSSPNLGHAIRYGARRPASVGGFFEYIDPELFELAVGFFQLREEAQALSIARALEARYVLTWLDPQAPAGSLLDRLHAGDAGARGGEPAWSHFRLIHEGPRGGQPLIAIAGRRSGSDAIPYKLFEIVAGAELALPVAPGSVLEAALPLRSPLGRSWVWRQRASAGPDGLARLRLPYPTGPLAPVHSEGAYRIRAGETRWELFLDEARVRSGGFVTPGELRATLPVGVD